MAGKFIPGDSVGARLLIDMSGRSVAVPDPQKLVHLSALRGMPDL
jgi:hypothetical protein